MHHSLQSCCRCPCSCCCVRCCCLSLLFVFKPLFRFFSTTPSPRSFASALVCVWRFQHTLVSAVILHRRLILPLAITPGPGVAFTEDTLKRSRASALTSLGKLVHEQCVLYYGRCSRRVSEKLAERRAAADAAPGGAGLPGEFLARCAFKVGH